jgi:isopentenyldiphosphate isomerase
MADIERYEVLDDQGHKTGQILDGSTVHSKELWHAVVNVWIVNSNREILMQLRGPNVEIAPGVWDVAIGSHLAVGEEPRDAALRALHEGLGLNMMPDDLKHLFNIQCANPLPGGKAHKVLGHVFMVQKDIDLGELSYDKDKIVKFVWVPLIGLMNDVGGASAKDNYFPRAGNYYPQLFEAFQSWM